MPKHRCAVSGRKGVFPVFVGAWLIGLVGCFDSPDASARLESARESSRGEGRALAEISEIVFSDVTPGLADGVVLRIEFPGVDVVYAATSRWTRALSWGDVNESLETNVFLEPGPPMLQYNVIEQIYAPGSGTWVPMGGIHHNVVQEGVLHFASSEELKDWLHRNTEGRREPKPGDHAFTYLNAGVSVVVGLGLYPSNGVMGFEVWSVQVDEATLADVIPPTPELVRVLEPPPASR